MNFYGNRNPKDALYYFGLIASIPHPSGYEKELVETLKALALEHGLQVKQDDAGNLRIDRPASKGMENAPHIILQGHLDMVPKAAPGKEFDFTTQPIELIEENGYLRANGTTLGADNGAGAASVLALLFDPDLKAGAISGLFTISEEIGLIGANKIDKELLQGDWLLNLDSGNYHNFCIGCAGGARLSFDIPFTRVSAPEGNSYSIQINGLEGGHSGCKIHEKCGNSLILMSQFLQTINCDAVSSLNGGSADNAIPAEASAEVISPLSDKELRSAAERFRNESAETFNAPKTYQISIIEIPALETVIEPSLMKVFLQLTATVPNEVAEMDSKLNIVKTSSNFASVHTGEKTMIVHTSQRSLEDPAREAMTEKIKHHFSPLNPIATVSGVYPGWPAKADSEAIKFVSGIHQEIYGELPGIYALHAGLEPGAFSIKNPDLQLVSFGPEELDIHTERERLDLAKYEEFNQLLRHIIERAAKN